MKRKWLIGLLSIFMVLAMCFGFAACGGDEGGDKGGEGGEQNTQTTDQATADAAIASLKTLYKDGETASAYKVLGQTKVNGTNYTITWTVTSDDVTNITDYVQIGTMDDTTKQITIDIVKGDSIITYKLKATVTVGTASASLEVTKTIPAKPRDAKGTEDDPYSVGKAMEVAESIGTVNAYYYAEADKGNEVPTRVWVTGYVVDTGNPTYFGSAAVGWVYLADEYDPDKNYDKTNSLCVYRIEYDDVLKSASDLWLGAKMTVKGHLEWYQGKNDSSPSAQLASYKKADGTFSDIYCTYLEEQDLTPAERAEKALGNVQSLYYYNAVGEIDLPQSTDSKVTFAWESDNTTYTVGEGKLHIGSIPATDTLVTLTVTATCEGETATKQVKVTIKATPTQPQGGLLLTVDTLFPGNYSSAYKDFNGDHTVGTTKVTTNQVMFAADSAYLGDMQVQGSSSAHGSFVIEGHYTQVKITLRTSYDLTTLPTVQEGSVSITGTADEGTEDGKTANGYTIKKYVITYTLNGAGNVTITNPDTHAMYITSIELTKGEDTRTPQQKVTAALAAVQTSYNVTTAGDYTLPTPTVDGVTFSWAKKTGDYNVTNNTVLAIGNELPDEACDVVLTLTAAYGTETVTDNTKNVTFHISAKPSTPSGDLQEGFNPLTAAPTQAGEYLIGMDAKGTWYYLTGGTDGQDFRLKVSSNASEAATFTVEPEGDGFVIKYGTKYLEIVKNGEYVNSLYRDSRTAECVWKWNATYNTLTVDITGTTNNKDGTYFLGSYNDYTSNMSASFVSNLTKENEYPSRLGLYKAPAGGTTDPGTGGGTGGETQEGDASISFADTANRDSITAEEEVWTENGITVTHSKGTGNDIDTSKKYSNPIRIYKNHTLKIEYSSAITKIVFHSDKDYPANGSYSASPYYSNLKSVLEAAFPGATITSDDTNNVITLVLATPSKSVEFTSTVGQTRLFSLDISTETGTQGGGTGGGTGGDTPTTHVCGHVCPICGKCTDESCDNAACADKCEGHEGTFNLTTENLFADVSDSNYNGTHTVNGTYVTTLNVTSATQKGYTDANFLKFTSGNGKLTLKGTFTKITIKFVSTYGADNTGNKLTVKAGDTALVAVVDSSVKTGVKNGKFEYSIHTVSYAVTTQGEQTITILKDANYDAYVSAIIFEGTPTVGGTVEHVCADACPVCGKCTTDCTDPVCTEKCPKNHNYGTLEAPLSVADVLTLVKDMAAGNYTPQVVYAIGKVNTMGTSKGTYWSNFVLEDTTDAQKTIGAATINLQSGVEEPKAGDEVVICGYISNRSGTLTFASKGSTYVNIVKNNGSATQPQTAQQKVDAALAAVQSEYTVTVAEDYLLPAAPEGLTFAWESNNETYKITNGNALAIGEELPAEACDVTLTLTVTCGDEAVSNNTKTVTIHINAKATTPATGSVVTFDFETACTADSGTLLSDAAAKTLFDKASNNAEELIYTSVTLVYEGTGAGGANEKAKILKMGSSGNAAKIVLGFTKVVKSVTLKAQNFAASGTAKTISVNGSEEQSLNVGSSSDLTFDLTGSTTLVTITSEERAYIYSIKVTLSEDTAENENAKIVDALTFVPETINVKDAGDYVLPTSPYTDVTFSWVSANATYGIKDGTKLDVKELPKDAAASFNLTLTATCGNGTQQTKQVAVTVDKYAPKLSFKFTTITTGSTGTLTAATLKTYLENASKGQDLVTNFTDCTIDTKDASVASDNSTLGGDYCLKLGASSNKSGKFTLNFSKNVVKVEITWRGHNTSEGTLTIGTDSKDNKSTDLKTQEWELSSPSQSVTIGSTKRAYITSLVVYFAEEA